MPPDNHTDNPASCYFDLVCKKESLLAAWEKIKEKGASGGIDNVNIELFGKELETNISDLSAALSSNCYIPEPYKEIKIPKDNHEFRHLSLPTIKDKIVQQAVKDIAGSVIERDFLDVSYAYREGKGATRAIGRVTHLITNEKRNWVSICDIDKYFDSISHDILFKKLSDIIKDQRLLNLFQLWVKMGKVDSLFRWKDTLKGIPQGSIISPILSNLYLHSFDVFMVGKDFGFVRYADDFIILSHTEAEAQRALKDASWFLVNELRLSLNPGMCVKNIEEGVEFLGILFKGAGKTVAGEKINDLKEKLLQGIRKIGNGSSIGDVTEGINRYYAELLPQDILETLDSWFIDRLKEELKQKYQERVFKSKAEIETALSSVCFMSQKQRLFKNKNIKNILMSCRKTRAVKSDASGSDPKDPGSLVKKKKHLYRELESAGFELVITKPGVFIGRTARGVVVKEKGVKLQEKQIANLKNITILSSGVTISSNLIKFCAEENITIDFIDYSGSPYAKLSPFENTSAELGVAQLEAFRNRKAQELAKQVVIGKIVNQINIINYYSKYRLGRDKDFTAVFDSNIGAMTALSEEVENICDEDLEIVRGKLFSVEGRAAGYYWAMVETILNENIEFAGRVRRGATDLVNSLLNYGYGILYSRIWTAVLQAGLNPHISYLHKPQDKKPALIFDLIEEFRQPIVDRAIFPLITKGEALELKDGLLAEDTRRKVIDSVLDRLETPEKWHGKELRLAEIIREQTKKVAIYLTGGSKKYQTYRYKW